MNSSKTIDIKLVTDYSKSEKPGFNVDREMRFTEVYIRNSNKHPHIREAYCLQSQTRDILLPIVDGDWFAGRIDRMSAGIDPERGDLIEAAYFCRYEFLKSQLSDNHIDSSTIDNINFLLTFWENEDTYHKCRQAFPERLKQGLPSDDYYHGKEISFPMYGLGGPCLDYQKLVKLGIPGLKKEIEHYKSINVSENENVPAFYQSLEMVLEIFIENTLEYANQAYQQGLLAQDISIKNRYKLIAQSCENITNKVPQSLHEAIQLVWLYSLMALPRNYGRMDVYLGDFLCNDLDSAKLTYDDALEMATGLWKLNEARGDNFNNRIIVGGKGRPNEKNADRFAMLALDVQSHLNQAIPQLSLRWYKDMNPGIWEKTIDVIGKGSTFPIIYNDDVNIPAVEKAFGVSSKEAEQYMMYGCGEYVIDHISIGSPDAAINVAKALDVTLFNGTDPFYGAKVGLELGNLKDYQRFEELQAAFVKQIENQVEMLAIGQETIYKETSKYAAFPFLSLLYNDCIARGKPLLSGGVRHLGGTLESFGNNTAADALFAIKKAVFEQKIYTSRKMMELLFANFEGNEKERQFLKSIAKFGNDKDDVDAMSLWVNKIVCEAAQKQRLKTSLDSFNVVLVNNGDSVMFGKYTGATADGRKAGEPVSNGNQPGAGYDINGVTALLNSMAKLDPSLHAGATHNLKLGKKLFGRNTQQVSALIKGYFANGGTQLMITVLDAEELQRALKEPEKYANLIVRVGGYSERFVNLPVTIQQEILKRTLYEG